MWIAVLLVLLLSGTIFFGLARYYMHLQEYKKTHDKRKNITDKQKMQIEELGIAFEIHTNLLLISQIIESNSETCKTRILI